jgi:peptidoglycan/LPS O-acetylase OafA/YrhL
LEFLVTSHPLSRLPVFAAGVAAGLLELRGANEEAPWPSCRRLPQAPAEPSSSSSWDRLVDRSTVVLMAAVALSLAKSILPGLADIKGLSRCGELALVPLQLCVVRGLARPGDDSRLGRLCRSPPLQWLGRHSLAIYLLHDPLIKAAVFQLWMPQAAVTTILSCTAGTLALSPLATWAADRLARALTSPSHNRGSEILTVQGV